MTLIRDFNIREIIVSWTDDVMGDQEKRFTFEQKHEAFGFAMEEFNQLAM